MIYLFYSLTLIGLVLLSYGAKELFSLLLRKELLILKMNDNLSHSFIVTNVGAYNLCFIDKTSIDEVKLYSSLNEDLEIELEENQFKYKFWKKNKKWSEFYKFDIDFPREYIIKIFPRKEFSNFDFLIVKAIPNAKKILSIVTFTLGFNIFSFGVLILISEKFQIMILGYLL